MSDDARPTPVLVHLSGARRGAVRELSGDEIPLGPRAALHARGTTYELIAAPDAEVWVNGERVERLALASGDVIELEPGEVLRFRLYAPGRRPRRSATEVFSDCLACARTEADTLVGRAARVAGGLPRDLVTQTSTPFRVGVVIVLAALIGTTWTLQRRSAELERQLAGVTRVEGLAALLERNRLERQADPELTSLLNELRARLDSTSARVAELEERRDAVGNVVRKAARATVFLQGAYGFDDPATGRPLRIALAASGRPTPGPGGEPLLTTTGNGPLLEIFYTGTGFVVSGDGLVLTNRHVAYPWEFEEAAVRLIARGARPAMRRFLGYLPGDSAGFAITVVGGSEEADVAVLRCSGVTAAIPSLPLASESPAPGDEVVVLGYPLGIQALMARADPDFILALRQDRGADFWTVARRLAEGGYIAPLATRGIVGQLTDRFIVYDAETTHGGSGGPVLDLKGRVVAVNAAILPEFGGSNLGVPAARARDLLRTIADDARDTP